MAHFEAKRSREASLERQRDVPEPDDVETALVHAHLPRQQEQQKTVAEGVWGVRGKIQGGEIPSPRHK